MENNKRKKQIEIARERVIKRRWLKRMADFEVFQAEVYSAAKDIFGVIPVDIQERIDLELTRIQINNRTIMLATIVSVMKTLEKKGIMSKLSLKSGHNVSLVCYLLGISTFNPMKHPQLITETYIINTLESAPVISIRIDKDRQDAVDAILYDLGLEVEREEAGPIHIRKVKYIDDNKYDFTLQFMYGACCARLQQVRNVIGTEAFENIPDDDMKTMTLINNLDLYGTTTGCFAPITIEAIRQIQPKTISELTEVLAFCSERQYQDLQRYIYNRANHISTYTEYPEIDSILKHTHGALLFTRQKNDILKLRIHTSESDDPDAEKKKVIREVCKLLLPFQLSNKCDKYVEAYNLYRLAYAKVHYPDAFQKVIESNINLK